MAASATSLTVAPLAGTAGARLLNRRVAITAALLVMASFAFLAWSWRQIPGGPLAAALGHAALIVSVAALAQVGRAARARVPDRLAAAMTALVVGAILVAGIFAMAPLTANVSSAQSEWLLLANPLMAVTSAAGIDLLHLDTFYRTSPLAHRGVVLPAWTTACAVYAVAGLAFYGVSRIRPRSHQR